MEISDSLAELENLFRIVDDKSLNYLTTENDYFSQMEHADPVERINIQRNRLTKEIENSLDQSIRKINKNYKQLKKQDVMRVNSSSDLKKDLLCGFTQLEFKTSSMILNDTDFLLLTHANDFDLNSKLKYIHLFDTTEQFKLDVRFQNRSKVFVFPLSKWKIFVHYKDTNLIEILLRKQGHKLSDSEETKTCVLNKVELDEKYHCKFNIFNAKIYAVLSNSNCTMLNIYDENLKLLSSKRFSEVINIISMNETELIYWSSCTGYRIESINNNWCTIEANLSNLNGVLLHVSDKRIYCLENDLLVIYDRSTLEKINHIKVNLSTSFCFKFDILSRVYVKTGDNQETIVCYDQNGYTLFKAVNHNFEKFNQFEFMNNKNIFLINLNQNNNITII